MGIISTNYSENESVAQLNHAMCTGTSREEDMFQEGLASRQMLLAVLWQNKNHVHKGMLRKIEMFSK